MVFPKKPNEPPRWKTVVASLVALSLSLALAIFVRYSEGGGYSWIERHEASFSEFREAPGATAMVQKVVPAEALPTLESETKGRGEPQKDYPYESDSFELGLREIQAKTGVTPARARNQDHSSIDTRREDLLLSLSEQSVERRPASASTSMERPEGVIIEQVRIVGPALVLFVSMLLGIIGRAYYELLEAREAGRDVRFSLLPLVRAAIVAPIVFLGVLNFSNFELSLLTVCFSFQNGFSWQALVGGAPLSASEPAAGRNVQFAP